MFAHKNCAGEPSSTRSMLSADRIMFDNQLFVSLVNLLAPYCYVFVCLCIRGVWKPGVFNIFKFFFSDSTKAKIIKSSNQFSSLIYYINNKRLFFSFVEKTFLDLDLRWKIQSGMIFCFTESQCLWLNTIRHQCNTGQPALRGLPPESW